MPHLGGINKQGFTPTLTLPLEEERTSSFPWRGKVRMEASGHVSRRISPLAFMLLMLLLLAAACSSDSDDPIISSEQEAGGPDYSARIITTDMAVGHNRLVFGVIDLEGMPVRAEASEVVAYFLVPR